MLLTPPCTRQVLPPAPPAALPRGSASWHGGVYALRETPVIGHLPHGGSLGKRTERRAFLYKALSDQQQRQFRFEADAEPRVDVFEVCPGRPQRDARSCGISLLVRPDAYHRASCICLGVSVAAIAPGQDCGTPRESGGPCSTGSHRLTWKPLSCPDASATALTCSCTRTRFPLRPFTTIEPSQALVTRSTARRRVTSRANSAYTRPRVPASQPPRFHFVGEARQALHDLGVWPQGIARGMAQASRLAQTAGRQAVPDRVADHPGKWLVDPEETVTGIREERSNREEIKGECHVSESLGDIGGRISGSRTVQATFFRPP